MATNDTAPSRSLENCDDECLTSPPSSTSSPSADFTDSTNSNLRSTVCSTSGYERVSLDDEVTDAVGKESAVSQPKPTHCSLTDSLGLLSGHLAHSNDLDDQLNSEASTRASPHSSPGTTNPDTFHHDSPVSDSSKSRYAWITAMAAEFSRRFRKLGRRGHDPERGDDSFDDEAFNRRYCEPPSYCTSRKDVKISRSSLLVRIILFLSAYSTAMSFTWFVVSLVQPPWTHNWISTKEGRLKPTTATWLTALLSKTIELSFVTVFITLLGQFITRKSFRKRNRGGMTLAEITMRNWIIQPGSLLTHWETVKYAGLTPLGVLTLIATITSMFFTTASDALVSPKLMYGDWEPQNLTGSFDSLYANVDYIKNNCPDMFGSIPRNVPNDIACMQIQFAGQSHRNLFSFMSTWADMKASGTSIVQELKDRPTGKHLLYENITMTATWIDTDYGNVTASFEQYGRIVNNVTMAMPHPGVYAAATAPENNIMQPVEMAGVGEYKIMAGVVSPTVNVMCVNMDTEDLAPIVYTEWPNSNLSRSHTDEWLDSVPPILGPGKSENFNRTVVDEIFRWGPKFKRRPPVFPLLPIPYNMVSSPIVDYSDAIYVLVKRPKAVNYTLCEMRSWLSPFCHTEFDSSGISGTSMRAVCEDPHDENAYYLSFPPGTEWAPPSSDWTHVAVEWSKSLGLHGGNRNSNNSNAHQLTQLALNTPTFLPDQPSLAEALAVLAGSTLVMSSIKTPFRHYWEYLPPQLIKDKTELLQAVIRTQQYKSGHSERWQGIFYVVLGTVTFINAICLGILVYMVWRPPFVTDFTEPQNLFTLAMNSPPNTQLKGSCGGGPEKRDLVVPWRVAYASTPQHYFLMEANERPWKGKYSKIEATTDENEEKANNYIRLSQGTYPHEKATWFGRLTTRLARLIGLA
ncbi:hypothetical protein E4U19_003959 [Claviceps sp. Clav32 group G5]|nr:hypothetical protein E4U19_003959 [Claviceps sp. Clav32 group G5]KAG6043573.1 hypothetical protein E4U39_004366 [Claviceps sp. Clav50 group G5]